MKLLFFDLETTGLNYKTNGIVQIAAIVVDVDENGDLKPIDKIDLKMKPDSSKLLDPEALKVNKLTEYQIESFMPSAQAFWKFIDFLYQHKEKDNKLDKLTLVGYNSLSFDICFLRSWFRENGVVFSDLFWGNSIDVFSEASRYLFFYRAGMKNFKLENVARSLKISIDNLNLHNAMFDTSLTLKVFAKIHKDQNKMLPFDEEYASWLFTDQQNVK